MTRYSAAAVLTLMASGCAAFTSPLPLKSASSSLISKEAFHHPAQSLGLASFHRSSFAQRSCVDITTRLQASLRPLVERLSESSNGISQTVLVGGKGGVGKTTTSAALAVELASSGAASKILVVSTDPAHSLGDALDEKLGPRPMTLTDPLTQGRLDACELDPSEALDQFREALAGFDVGRLAEALNVPVDLLEGLGLGDFSDLLNSPPPGLDELVALGNVLDDRGMAADYDVIVVDTAPTGHTLRLLTLPKFLDGLLGKLLKLRAKLSGLTSTLQAFMGNTQAQERADTIDKALTNLETFKARINRLEDRLHDSSRTSFVVVTVPTTLAVQESKRLIKELSDQKIAVNHVVANQCVISGDDEEDGTKGASSEALANYYTRRRSGQEKWIGKLQEAINDVKESNEFIGNGGGSIELTQMPFFDVELVGIPALGYVGNEHLANNPNLQHLMGDDNDSGGPRVVICGGKGGVGKTTTSSSLAVSMAAHGGHKVALISTDPAHSLGDAVDMDLHNGGRLVEDCSLIGVPGYTGEGSLSVLEIDPASALGRFKGIIEQLLGDNSGSDSQAQSTIKEIEQIFDTLPAGTDEVVALAQVVQLVQKGGFDRIVLDTAPTGHTLRMLSTPGFLADLIDRVLEITQKINNNAAIKMLVNSAVNRSAKQNGKSREEVDTAAASAKSALLKFQLQMYDLEDLFSNADRTEFVIVTVPTELAVRESVRLLNDLTFSDPPIKVRNVVANQILQDDDEKIQTFLSHVHTTQLAAIGALRTHLASGNMGIDITTVPYLDTEPRGVFGLKALAVELVKDDAANKELV